MSDEKDATRSLLNSLSRVQDLFRRYVVALIIDDDRGWPEVIGSGLLVSGDGDDVFLISAAHVFDWVKTRPVYFYSDLKKKRILSGTLSATPIPEGKTRNDDTLDIGVLKLSSEGGAMPPYPTVNLFPLPWTRLRQQALPREGKRYLMLGHPTTKTKVNPNRREVKNEPFANYCRSADPARYAELGLDPETNIVLVFDERDVYGKNGLKQNPPQLNGMSGCPIWLLADERHDATVSREFDIVGVFTDHKKGGRRVLVGTDISVALLLMRPF